MFYLNYSTGSTLALKPDFEEEKIPVIPASFHAGNLVDSNYIFLPIASYSSQAVGLAEYVVANHKGSDKPKVAMFIHPSAFGRGTARRCEKSDCRRPEHRTRGSGGARQGSGQHGHAATSSEAKVCST